MQERKQINFKKIFSNFRPLGLCQETNRVKSGKFGQSSKFGQLPCLLHVSNVGIKNKLTKQTVKILMRRLIRSPLIWFYTVFKRVSEFT